MDNLRVAVYFGGKLYGFFCAGVVSFLAVQKLHMRKVDERGWVFFSVWRHRDSVGVDGRGFCFC